MTTDDRPEVDLDPDDAETLYRLIRLAREKTATEIPIHDNLIALYLTKQARAAEITKVQAVIESSSEFREEILYLAGLYDRETQRRFDETPVPQATGKAESGESRTEPANRPTADRRIQPKSRPLGRLALWGAGLVPAAVLVLVLILSNWLAAPGSDWSQAPALTIDQLAPSTLRGTGSNWPTPVTTDQAALHAFLRNVEWDGQTLNVSTPTSPPSGRSIEIRIAGIREPYRTMIPESSEEVEVWFLGVPSLKLYHQKLATGQGLVTWPAVEDRLGALSLSYVGAEGPAATPPGQVRQVQTR